MPQSSEFPCDVFTSEPFGARLRSGGLLLLGFNELREALQLRVSGEFKRLAEMNCARC